MISSQNPPLFHPTTIHLLRRRLLEPASADAWNTAVAILPGVVVVVIPSCVLLRLVRVGVAGEEDGIDDGGR